MKVVDSSIFHVVCFPHQGNIITIDQLDYFTPDLQTNSTTNVPFVGDSPGGYSSVDVGLFKDSSLLGTFTIPLPNTTHVSIVNMISFIGH